LFEKEEEIIWSYPVKKCRHGRDSKWCVDCRYGKYGQGKDRFKDLVDDMNKPLWEKLKMGYGLLNTSDGIERRRG